MPVVSRTCAVSDFWGVTPELIWRQVGVGRPFRMVVMWPVPSLHATQGMSSRTWFVSFRSSMTLATLSPSKRF